VTASRLQILLAALMGGAGVALWAGAAHGGEANLTTAAQMLLIHAAAVLGLVACRKHGLAHDRTASLAAAALVLGVALFAADLYARTRVGARLFPMAAPLGGGLAILGWGLLALAAVIGRKADGR
jgi:uncharacterized membrane protein YgdD (TMEM256/DUF423 family)